MAFIVLDLRDRNLQAIGYYSKIKEEEKAEAYSRWKNGEVQVMASTRAFGLGINEPSWLLGSW